MRLTLVTGPSYMPVTLAEVKVHLRITDTDNDEYLQSLILMATLSVEEFLKRRLITQTWQLHLDRWPDGNEIVLPIGPLASVTHVKYTDTAESQSTLSSANYSVKTAGTGRIILDYSEAWPTDALWPADPIEVQFVVGYGAHTPQAITGATNATPIVLTAVGHGYSTANRVKVVDVGGNTNADGQWTIEKVGADTFKLLGSAGAAEYTSGGTVTLLSVPEAIRQAMLLQISGAYEVREPIVIGTITSEVPMIWRLLNPYRYWAN